MKKDFDESLLTAYLDDELSGSERRRVEEHLRQFPDSRQTLKELAEVSALLRALPSESLPELFPQQVFQGAGRRPGLAPSRRVASKRVIWWGGAGLAAAAAALLLMVFSMPEKEPVQMATRIAPEARDESSALVRRTPLLDEGGAGNRVASERASSRALRRDSSGFSDLNPPRESSRPGRASRRTRAPRSNLQTALSASAAKEDSAGPSKYLYFSSAEHVEPGKVVDAAVADDGQVRVVELTVVDREKSIEAIQRLFDDVEELGIEGDDKKASADSGRWQAALVRSNPRAFEQSLQQLQKDNPAWFVSLGVQNEIPVALQSSFKELQVRGPVTPSSKTVDPYAGALNLLNSEEREHYNQKSEAPYKRHRESDNDRSSSQSPEPSRRAKIQENQPFSVLVLIREQPGANSAKRREPPSSGSLEKPAEGPSSP